MKNRVEEPNSCTILIVDDDPAMRSLLADELSDNGCHVIESPDGHDAMSQIETCVPNVVVTDLKMPGGGFEYLRNLIASVQDCPVVLVTAFGNAHTKRQAKECGIAAYFDKPVRVKDLKAALQQICPIVKSQTCQNRVVWDNERT